MRSRPRVVHVGDGPTHPDRRVPVRLLLSLALAPSLGAWPPDGTDRHHQAREDEDYAAFVRNPPRCCAG